MEEKIYLNVIDSDVKIPFILTYGIFKELQEYLNQNSNLFNMFTDPLISETVIKIALSDRDEIGSIVKEFTAYNTINAADMVSLLDFIFDSFSNFFYSHQEKIVNLTKQLEKLTPSE
jgi:hypothetical protein